MNKLRPMTISRIDPREDGFILTYNVTKFLASCSSQGVPADELFYRDDLIEATPESLARVAQTVISVVKVVETPLADRSKIITGQGKKATDNGSTLYGYGTSSRAAASVPNLTSALQRSASPTSPITPNGRKRWTPPSPVLPTVRSVSPSERGSGTGSSKTAQSGNGKDGKATPIEQSYEISPPTLTPKSPLRAQSQSKQVLNDDDVFSAPKSRNIIVQPMLRGESTSTSVGDSPSNYFAESPARESMVSSTATDTSAYSSLLDARNPSNGHNKFGTIRTMTTEATSFTPSDMPSFTRTEASSVAASLAEEMARKRGKEPGMKLGRERKPSEAAAIDLSRVAEERPEDIASRPGSKAGPAESRSNDRQDSQDRVHLGKGKWPDDFLGVFQGPARTRPIPINIPGRDRQESSSLNRHSPISVSPPRKLAYVGASKRSESVEAIPRRPSHRSRHSVDTPGLAPKESILRRDISPDGLPASGPRVILRRSSTKGGAQWNGSHLSQNSLEEPQSSKEDAEPLVPFPRTNSGEYTSAILSSEGAKGADISDKPRQPRGRFQSDIEGMSSSKRARPISYDELGNKHRRTRIESMVNLGVGSSNASASDLMSRSSMDGSAVRQTLIVREDGKPPTHFVSSLHISLFIGTITDSP